MSLGGLRNAMCQYTKTQAYSTCINSLGNGKSKRTCFKTFVSPHLALKNGGTCLAHLSHRHRPPHCKQRVHSVLTLRSCNFHRRQNSTLWKVCYGALNYSVGATANSMSYSGKFQPIACVARKSTPLLLAIELQ